ncbi:MAG TPA: YtxH domain-containing protein [Methylomirabilota bacterium]|nr:YtxH domain-containing protein [Methylomirabilota bacterium]
MVNGWHSDVRPVGLLGLLVVGSVIGAGVALLYAPLAGKQTRRIIWEKGTELAREAQRFFERSAKDADATPGAAPDDA